MRSRPRDECSKSARTEGPWETTTSIGRRWKHSNVFEPSGTNCPTASVFFKLCNAGRAPARRGRPGPHDGPEALVFPTCHEDTGRTAGAAQRKVGGHSEGAHLFPSRTEQLSPSAPMVLAHAGRVGRRQPFLILKKPYIEQNIRLLFLNSSLSFPLPII